MIIIGITGTIGAGKGVTVEYLQSKGFQHYSVRGYLLQELNRRGIEVNRNNMTDLANLLREEHGPGYILQKLYEEAEATGKNSVIESVRAIGEVEFLKSQKDFYLLAVDADQKIRYERIVNRKSELDNVTYEKFLSDDAREMVSPDPTKGNIAECMRRADRLFINNGTLEELYRQVDLFLSNLPK